MMDTDQSTNRETYQGMKPDTGFPWAIFLVFGFPVCIFAIQLLSMILGGPLAAVAVIASLVYLWRSTR
jgi:hypothetical protein